MHYAIMDSNANLIGFYEVEDEALKALQETIDDEPNVCEELALFTYSDDDQKAAPTLTGDDLLNFVKKRIYNAELDQTTQVQDFSPRAGSWVNERYEFTTKPELMTAY
jgi:hypothetical protein